MERFWSRVEYLHQTVKNPNILVKGTHSYYSNAWGGGFEDDCVRYLYGDEHSLKNWRPQWQIDRLLIGDYVCIGSEAVILLGGNHTHRMDWFSCYPFPDKIAESYQGKGDTVIADGAWIGLRAVLLPGVHIGEGAVVGAGAVVARDVPPYAVYAGNPAREVKLRFPPETVRRLLALHIYDLSEETFNSIRPFLCGGDIDALETAVRCAAGNN